MEQAWFIVAFGDLRGFGAWTYRAGIPPEVRRPFEMAFHGCLERFVREKPFFCFKFLADGMMIAREFPKEERTPANVAGFVRDVLDLTDCVICELRRCESPPGGWRVRFADGYADKFQVLDPYDPERRRTVPELLGYTPNAAERLLGVYPHIGCLALGGLSSFLRNQPGFRVVNLPAPVNPPDAINPEDLQHLIRIDRG